MPSNFRHMIKSLTPRLALPASYRDPGEILTDRHFTMTLGAALALHLAALLIWHLVPKTQVIDIPVRALNIKLGDGEVFQQEAAPAQPVAANKPNVESALSRLVRDPKPAVSSIDKAVMPDKKTPKAPSKAPPPKERKFDMRSEGVNVAAPVMPVTARQFVRDIAKPAATPAVKSDGAKEGNSAASHAEMISRYEQLISLWIQKFKLYPEQARLQSMQGETVVRIRIDRRGNIRYYALERSTGYEVLDRAAIDMMRRANPVPAVPNEYPPGELLEFLIPVNFQLQ
jgi:periplasmic protein TonB